MRYVKAELYKFERQSHVNLPWTREAQGLLIPQSKFTQSTNIKTKGPEKMQKQFTECDTSFFF